MPVARVIRPGSPIPATTLTQFLGDDESLPDRELLRVLDALFVGFENLVPTVWRFVEFARDRGEGVALADGIGSLT